MPAESDLIFLRAAVPDLRDYILSNELYWTLRPGARMPGGSAVPQLTIGNLLLAQARLAAIEATPEENLELANLSRQVQAVREEWLANWGQKAGREFSSRLNLWQQYLRELRGDGRAQSAYFAREVRNRAILTLLAAELRPEVPAAEKEQLAMLDTILRGLTTSAEFAWEPELARAFPPETFWYLYVQPGRP